MAITVLTFVSTEPVDLMWPGRFAATAGSDLREHGGSPYSVNSFVQDGTQAVLVFEWSSVDDIRVKYVLNRWTEFAATAGLTPHAATVGPKLGSRAGTQRVDGVEGFRFSIVPGAGGGLGVKT